MRVITGTARGRKLMEPRGMEIRPTTDQVKEAAYNIVQFDVEGRRVLDLFAGTGQMGIEALSRGAASCTFIDAGREAVALVKENLKRCQLQAQVLQTDAISYLSTCGAYDLIFLDPPYDTDLLERALMAIEQFDILSEGGIILCESRREKPLPALSAPYCLKKEYRYGKLKLTVYTRKGNTGI